MEDDEELENRKREIAKEVTAIEEDTGLARRKALEDRQVAFESSIAQLKDERLDLLKQRAQLTQEMEKRGLGRTRSENEGGGLTSESANKKKFDRRKDLISRLIDDAGVSHKLLERLKKGESILDAKREVELETSRERKKKEQLKHKREKDALKRKIMMEEESNLKAKAEARGREERQHNRVVGRERGGGESSGSDGEGREEQRPRRPMSRVIASAIPPRRRRSSQQEEIPAYVRNLQAQISALQASLLVKSEQDQLRIQRENKERSMRQAEDVADDSVLDPDLPKSIQKDSEMIRLHQSHQRDMLKLQYEIERVQREVELEKIRSEISKLRDEKDNPDVKEPARLKLATSRRVSSVLVGNEGLLNKVQEKQQKDFGDNDIGTRTPPEKEVSGQLATFSDASPGGDLDLVPWAPAPSAESESYTITIHMNRMITTNFMLQGKVRVVAQFYDGVEIQSETIQSVETLGEGTGLGEMSSTSYVFPVYAEGNATNVFVWRDKLVISGVQINSATQVLFEIQTILEVEKEEGGSPTGWNKMKKMYSKTAFQNRPQVVGWAQIALTDPETNQQIEGHQTIPVYHLPKILNSAGKKYAMKDTSLELEVNITKKKIGKPKAHLSNVQRRLGSKLESGSEDDRRSDQGQGKSLSRSLDVSGIPAEAWVRARHALKYHDTFQPGDGLVIRVDAGRFFPENVTVTKVTVRFLTSERDQVGPNIESIGSLETSAYFPRYRLRCFVNTEDWDDPTVMALFTVETLEASSEDFCVVGYACLPIFVDPDTEKQPFPGYEGDYTLRSGSFQIPLHTCLPPMEATAAALSKEMDKNKQNLENTKLPSSSFDAQTFASQCPRISCASLLVRVLTAEEDDLVMLRGDLLPEYGSREYDTRQAEPIACEKLMYGFKLKTRSFLSTSELLKKEFFTEEEVEAIEEDKAGGRGEAMLVDWVKNRMTRPDLRNDVMLNYSHSFSYLHKLGFSVAVDGARNLVKGLPAFAFISLNPPGTFYRGSGVGAVQVTEDVAFTFKHDPQSKAVSPSWEDGLTRFPFVPYDPYLCVIIEVRYWNARSSRLTTLGWTAMPVFYKSEKQHVCTGYYNLPLFMGSPNVAFLESMSTTHFPEVVKGALDSSRLRIAKEAPSILVRLVDNQREGEISEPATDTRMKSKLKIPPFVPSKYAGAMSKESRGRKVYDKLKPRKANSYIEWRAEMAEQVSQISGVGYTKEDIEALLEEENESLSPTKPLSSRASSRTASRTASRIPSRAASLRGDDEYEEDDYDDELIEEEEEYEDESEYEEEDSEEEV